LKSALPRMHVVVWGLGRHAVEKILPAVAATDGLELYGVCSRDAAKVADCSRRWECRGWTTPDSMVTDARVDIVYVATPIGLHAEHGRAVLTAGKHFWSEKPFTSRLADTSELLERSRGLGLSACEGHMYLHHPQFSRLVSYIHSGRLGRLLSVTCKFGIPKLSNPGFRVDPHLGGGAFLDVGCYPISAVTALFPDEPTEIKYSTVSTENGSFVDTQGQCVLEVSGRTTVHLEWRTDAAYRNEIEVWGTDGSITTEMIFSKAATHRPEFRLRDSRGSESIEFDEAANHFERMLAAFRNAVGDRDAMESERQNIARRALLMDKIWAAASDDADVSRVRS
jgi:NDP-hexose-3-ketoreductase